MFHITLQYGVIGRSEVVKQGYLDVKFSGHASLGCKLVALPGM